MSIRRSTYTNFHHTQKDQVRYEIQSRLCGSHSFPFNTEKAGKNEDVFKKERESADYCQCPPQIPASVSVCQTNYYFPE